MSSRSSERATTLWATPAGCDSDEPARTVTSCSIPAKRNADRALQHVDEMARHVVPVPAGRRVERSNGADVLRADGAARSLRPAEVAVLDVGARTVAREVGRTRVVGDEPCQGGPEPVRSGVARRGVRRRGHGRRGCAVESRVGLRRPRRRDAREGKAALDGRSHGRIGTRGTADPEPHSDFIRGAGGPSICAAAMMFPRPAPRVPRYPRGSILDRNRIERAPQVPRGDAAPGLPGKRNDAHRRGVQPRVAVVVARDGLLHADVVDRKARRRAARGR